MQYAMLPTRRAGVMEVWGRIMMTDLDGAGKGIKGAKGLRGVYLGRGVKS